MAKASPEEIGRLGRRQRALADSSREALAHYHGHGAELRFPGLTFAERQAAYLEDPRVLAFKRANREWRLARHGHDLEAIPDLLELPEIIGPGVGLGFAGEPEDDRYDLALAERRL